MLKEIINVRQIENEPKRRWFNSKDMDLIVWYEDEKIIGFQLCYDKNNHEKALSWKPEAGLIHEKVDDGESRDGHYKATPILIKNGQFDLKIISENFTKCSADIDDDIRSFIFQNLDNN